MRVKHIYQDIRALYRQAYTLDTYLFLAEVGMHVIAHQLLYIMCLYHMKAFIQMRYDRDIIYKNQNL